LSPTSFLSQGLDPHSKCGDELFAVIMHSYNIYSLLLI
jgi:hypothetical protein